MDHRGKWFKGGWYNPYRPEPLGQSQGRITEWLSGALGGYLLAKERQTMSQLPDLPGYHLLELSVSPSNGLLDGFDQLHRFNLSSAFHEQQPNSEAVNGGAIADFEMLPLPSDVLDTVVIHHALEFSRRPHRVLNEAARVVAPGGHLVLFVLNPFSLFGALKWPIQLFRREQPLKYHSLRLGRVVDWLRLLHLKPVFVQRGGITSVPDTIEDNSSRIERWGYGMGLPSGLFYTIVARKQVTRPIIDRSELWNGIKIGKQALGWKPTASHQAFTGNTNNIEYERVD